MIHSILRNITKYPQAVRHTLLATVVLTLWVNNVAPDGEIDQDLVFFTHAPKDFLAGRTNVVGNVDIENSCIPTHRRAQRR